MFLLHFIPSAIITDICQIYIQIKRITVLLQDFLIGGAEIILCCDLLCFVVTAVPPAAVLVFLYFSMFDVVVRLLKLQPFPR